MSRYSIRIDNQEVVIGWDPPLETHFGQVHDLDLPEDEQIVLWVGTRVRELYDIEDLIRVMPGFRDFIRSHATDLYRDMDEGL